MKNERNYYLDIVKFIASFFVVCIHIPLFGGRFGIAVNAIARFAVPTFFAISGYFSLNADTNIIKRRTVKLLKMYLLSTAIYLAYNLALHIRADGITAIIDYPLELFLNIENIAKFTLFNLPFSSVHLWFLLAMIYVYLIWTVILKYSLSDKVLLLIASVCLALNLFLGEFLSIFGINISDFYLRNFALMGLPFFIIGYLIKKHSDIFDKIKLPCLIAGMILGSCEAVLSRFLIGLNDLHIGSVLCCISIMILADRIRINKLSRTHLAILHSSTDIYVFHILFGAILNVIISAVFPSDIAVVLNTLMPFWAFASCIVFYLLRSYTAAYIKSKQAKTQSQTNCNSNSTNV